MHITFDGIRVGEPYSRITLAKLWGYDGYQGLARGFVTPKDDNKIILFVTRDKQTSAEQYKDRLVGDILYWEGPNDHYAEDRMNEACHTGDETHVFYRDTHHSDFIYEGRFTVVSCDRLSSQPSKFVLKRR